ncbi:MAG: hypothetical protein V2B19_16405 [Pseudomonadota bacterium]
MSRTFIKPIVSVVVLITFVTSQLGIDQCFAISDYSRAAINPAVVPDPLIYSYTTCTDKYKYCTCVLVGAGVNDEVLNYFDTDGDSRLSFWEMRSATTSKLFNDTNNTLKLGDSTFLACHYDPPSPGPYSETVCKNRFGPDDCVCMGEHGNYYGQCYSKSIIKFSPEPVSVPEVFCSKLTVGGFDNCLCDDTQQDAYLAGDIKCYVMPEQANQNWECDTDILRIFTGSKYTCRIKDGFVFRPNCCPGDSGCAITDYDSGLGNMGSYLSSADTMLNAYIAYTGYSEMAGGASAVEFVGSLGTSVAENGISGTADAYAAYGQMGASLNPMLSALSSGLFYVAIAMMIYNYLATTFNTCKSGEYELICKAEADLCIYTGEHDVSSSKTVKVYMCYSSQIAKIVNEYGLPQIHAPGCHTPNCDAGYSAMDSCQCRAAYTLGGKSSATRHNGFSIDEFQRLDFSEIPISDVLKKTMLANAPDASGQDISQNAQLMTPSRLLTAQANGSPQDQAPPVSSGDVGQTKYVGDCTYNPDGSVKWPIERADFQMIDQSVGVPTATLDKICIAAPIPVPGRTFVADMEQDMDRADRLMLPQPSTANNAVPHISICNNAFMASGWDDIGDFTIGSPLKVGVFTAGLSCLDPFQIGADFYKRCAWYKNSYFYEVFTFTKNEINQQEQTATLPNQFWYWDTYDKDGVPTPATHYQDYWVYWLPETDINRGEWIGIENKCVLKDTEAANRTLCNNNYQTCYNICGDNDVCKQNCADTKAQCVNGPLRWLSPPPMPQKQYVNVAGKPAYIPPSSNSFKFAYIKADGHADFNRPASPVYAVVNVLAHPELTPPPSPKEIIIDTRAIGGIAVPGGYNPLTGESLTEPGRYFKDSSTCQSWYISNFKDRFIDVYLTNTCEPVGTGKQRADQDYYKARVRNTSTCPRGYTLGADCWNDGAVLYDASGLNPATGTYYKNDPICQNWYNSTVSSRKLDYQLGNNCSITPNQSPGPGLVYTSSRQCPAGFAEGVDCTFVGGRSVYDARGVALYEGGSMGSDPICLNWFNNLVSNYAIQARVDDGCFLRGTVAPNGLNTFNTTRKHCADLPGFTLGVDCFEDGPPIYDANGFDQINRQYFKNEPVCQNWYSTQITQKSILANLTNRCTLIPESESDITRVYTKFEVLGNACPAGFVDGVDCYHLGEGVYDPVTGYGDKAGRYFKEDPLCNNWYETEIVPRGIEADLQNNCTLKARTDIGKDFYPISLGACPQDTIPGTNCFCNCPSLVDDMENSQMICPRPNKKNLLQRLSVHNSRSSAFNAYYGRPDVQARYNSLLP